MLEPSAETGFTGTPVPPQPKSEVPRFFQRFLAEELAALGHRSDARLIPTLTFAKVDLHPHQLEAAVFALDSLERGGCVLADEVGLGKTIEAGLLIAQLVSEGCRRILVLPPAPLRAQWQAELKDKFSLEAVVVDGRTAAARGNCFDQPSPVVIASQPFAAHRPELLARISWDLVVIDEAHRLRNSHRPGHKLGMGLRAGLRASPKLLLTATPLQNGLSDLFGLCSLLREDLLGPEEAFRRQFAASDGLSDETAEELRRRLRTVVHRTLRRQVREYVKYPLRRSLVEDFSPSLEEQALYDDVSEFLWRDGLRAFPPSRRALVTLVCRKLLASSTFALASTLERLAQSISQKQEQLELDELENFSEEAESFDERDHSEPRADLAQEARELASFAARARAITVNAKGEALVRALDRIFTVARVNLWPEKVVIFTESLRTLDYLHALLSERGYVGRISRLTGQATSFEARQELIDEFRERTAILLSSEAGAEGLNLQFCNLVVNYDLPWNPQRIEQRIGRCHRYGQARDVVVLNFLNRANAADERLHEILEHKLGLFSGVFGASDEILGALGNGVDFERRVLDIYQSCRSPEEVESAFVKLREGLTALIDQRMLETRAMLLERFDADVRAHLKLAGDWARNAVAQRAGDELRLVSAVLGERAPTRERLREATQVVRARSNTELHRIALDGATLPAALAGLQSREGWWFAYAFEVQGARLTREVVHLVLLREGDGYHQLPLARSALFSRLAAREEKHRMPGGPSPTTAHDSALERARLERTADLQRVRLQELELALEQADRSSEDALYSLREHLRQAQSRWELARRAQGEAPELEARLALRSATARAEHEFRATLKKLRSAEQEVYEAKDKRIAEQERLAKFSLKASLISSAYFWID